jgi:hypothetical protein
MTADYGRVMALSMDPEGLTGIRPDPKMIEEFTGYETHISAHDLR